MSKIISSLPTVYIHPGGFHFSKKPELIITVLGSCLAIIMYNLERGICLAAHSVMPSYKNSPLQKDNEFKYVDSSILKMTEMFINQGIPKNKISLKLFGGAEQISKNKINSIGKQNIDKALALIKEEGLIVISMDIGGTTGRKIFLSSHTGEVLLKRLNKIPEKMNEKDKSINSR